MDNLWACVLHGSGIVGQYLQLTERSGVIDKPAEVWDGFSDVRIYIGDRGGITTESIGEEMAFLSVLRAIKEVMMDRFLSSRAYGAVRCVAPVDAVEVVVEWDMAGAKLNV